MVKRGLFVIAGVVAGCFALSVAPVKATEPFNVDGIMLGPPLQLPQLSLDDRQTFFFSSSFGWLEPTQGFLPTFRPPEPRTTAFSNTADPKNFVDNGVELRPADRLHAGGEIGFVYGRSSGKYGFEYEGGYVIGELGNDKFHLTVGTTYERYNWRAPRWGH